MSFEQEKRSCFPARIRVVVGSVSIADSASLFPVELPAPVATNASLACHAQLALWVVGICVLAPRSLLCDPQGNAGSKVEGP